jgi:hypothetical protein
MPSSDGVGTRSSQRSTFNSASAAISANPVTYQPTRLRSGIP